MNTASRFLRPLVVGLLLLACSSDRSGQVLLHADPAVPSAEAAIRHLDKVARDPNAPPAIAKQAKLLSAAARKRIDLTLEMEKEYQ